MMLIPVIRSPRYPVSWFEFVNRSVTNLTMARHKMVNQPENGYGLETPTPTDHNYYTVNNHVAINIHCPINISAPSHTNRAKYHISPAK